MTRDEIIQRLRRIALEASVEQLDGDKINADSTIKSLGFDSLSILDLLYDLVRTRLITTIVLMNWRLSAQPASDEYMKKGVLNERSSEVFLGRINAMSRVQFMDRLKSDKLLIKQ